MSEVDQILADFHHAKHAERTASGLEPAVCVAGHISYACLETALKLKYAGLMIQHGDVIDWMNFDNVKVFPSRSIETGFYFGHIEPRA